MHDDQRQRVLKSLALRLELARSVELEQIATARRRAQRVRAGVLLDALDTGVDRGEIAAALGVSRRRVNQIISSG